MPTVSFYSKRTSPHDLYKTTNMNSNTTTIPDASWLSIFMLVRLHCNHHIIRTVWSMNMNCMSLIC